MAALLAGRPCFSSPVVQPARKRKGSDDDDGGDWVADPDEEQEAEDEEAQFDQEEDIKAKVKGAARVGKGRELERAFFDRNPDVRPSSPVREIDVFAARPPSKSKKPRRKPSGLGSAKAAHKAACGRCNNWIRMDKGFREMGVGHGSKGRRKKPPLGHKHDLSLYRAGLEVHIKNNVPEKYQNEYRRAATWDRSNLRLEHFDCNATAPKINANNRTTRHDEKGRRLVLTGHPRWLAEAKKKVDGPG